LHKRVQKDQQSMQQALTLEEHFHCSRPLQNRYLSFHLSVLVVGSLVRAYDDPRTMASCRGRVLQTSWASPSFLSQSALSKFFFTAKCL